MGIKIIYPDHMLEKIKILYESGIGTVQIANDFGIGRHTVRKILISLGILKQKFHSDQFYSNFWQEGKMWCGYFICKKCNENIKFSVNKKCLLNRNLKRKKICKLCSLKLQIGTGNPFYGKYHTKKTIDKISKTKSGVSISNHMRTPKYKKLFSDMTKQRWANGSMDAVRVKMSNLMKQRIANGEFKGYIRSKAEDELIKILCDNEIDVTPNYKIDSKIFDLYIPKLNLLIEYNGDYWHCNPIKYAFNYINKKKNKTAQELWDYDAEKLYLAKTKGYNCEVIWETDYKQNKNIILEIIKNYGEHKHTDPSLSQN